MILTKQKQADAGWPRLKRIHQCIVLVMVLLCAGVPTRADEGPLVAAASSMRGLWPALVQAYTATTAQMAPRVSFGSSGLLSTQILNGAPFELFLSADVASIERLPQQFLEQAPQVFATGALNLVVPESSPLANSLSMETLATALLDPANQRSLRVAIPNPVHAPYGKAAQKALEKAGIWPLRADQLLTADNAAQTLQFVKNGVVAAAVVPQALVHAHDEGVVMVNVPPGSYAPVEHVIAIFEVAGVPAHAFYQWLLSDGAHRVLTDSGLRVDSN